MYQTIRSKIDLNFTKPQIKDQIFTKPITPQIRVVPSQSHKLLIVCTNECRLREDEDECGQKNTIEDRREAAPSVDAKNTKRRTPRADE